jgi:hypothetical protein
LVFGDACVGQHTVICRLAPSLIITCWKQAIALKIPAQAF